MSDTQTKTDYKGRPMDRLTYDVTQNKGTERAFSGAYTDTETPGVYKCIVCGAELFDSASKFHSGCGWPSFDDMIKGGDAGNVERHVDRSHGMSRTEVTCKSCGAHLGHVFNDGPTATGERYCINSVAVDLEPRE